MVTASLVTVTAAGHSQAPLPLPLPLPLLPPGLTPTVVVAGFPTVTVRVPVDVTNLCQLNHSIVGYKQSVFDILVSVVVVSCSPATAVEAAAESDCDLVLPTTLDVSIAVETPT